MPNTNNGITVLSLFDGISCGQVALQRAGIKVAKYYASEIDKSAIAVTQANWPNTIQLGSVTEVQGSALSKIGLLMGGSPCQNFSFAGKRNGMSTVENQEVLSLEHYLQLKADGYKFDGQSYLFWEYVRLLKETRPTHFLLENVKMTKKWENVISETLGVKPVLINSAKLSAQNRNRLYWTNIPDIGPIIDKGLKFSDVKSQGPYVFIESGKVANSVHTKNYLQYDINGRGNKSQSQRACYLHGKSMCLDTTAASNAKVLDGDTVRRMTRLECERLQTLPDGYTNATDENKAKRAIGNGWTVDVIAHIFKSLPPQT